MCRFLDGPAAGVALTLRRAPVVLRAVQNRAGKWDALDQPTDDPAPGEKVYVYLAVPGTFCSGHISRRPHGSMWFQANDYRLLEPQPMPEHFVGRRWPEWCDRNSSWLLEGFPRVQR